MLFYISLCTATKLGEFEMEGGLWGGDEIGAGAKMGGGVG